MNPRTPRASRSLRSACESLEARKLLFNTYVGQGDPNGVWGLTYMSYSYSNFLDSAPGWATGLSRLDMQNAVEEAMGVWTAVSPLRFLVSVDSGPMPSETPYDAGLTPPIRWGHHFIDGPGTPAAPLNVLAHALRPGTGGLNGDPHFDDSNTWTIDQIMETGAHEFGHAIGLAHANGDVVGGVCPGPGPSGAAVMDACSGSFDYTGLETAFLLPDDVAGIQSLYGSGLGYVIGPGGELNVYGTGANDLITVDFTGGNLVVSSTVINSGQVRAFSRPINDGLSNINSIQLHGSAGNDILRVVNSSGIRVNLYGGEGDDIYDVGFASNTFSNTGETQIFAGGGTDSLFAYDGSFAGSATYGLTATRFERTGFDGVRFFDDLENRTLTTGSVANTVNVFSTSANRPTTISNGGGQDVINIGSSNSVQNIQGNVTILNPPSFTTININDGATTAAKSVSHAGDGTFGTISGLAPGNITYKYADVHSVNVTMGTGADSVSIRETVKPIGFFNNGGRDQIYIGDVSVGTNFIAGNVQLNNADFVYTDIFINNFAGAGRTMNLAPLGGGSFMLSGAAAGGAITWRNVLLTRITGSQNGNDALTVTGVDDNSLFFDGGGGAGFDSLVLDDRTNPLAFVQNDIGPSGFTRTTGGVFGTALDFGMASIDAYTFYSRSSATLTNVVGVPSTIPAGQQATLVLGNSANVVNLYPRDAGGNPTINGNIGIVGGSAADVFRIQDATSTLPTTYTFSNPFGSGTQNVSGLGTGGVGTANIEAWEVFAGAGNDTFNMNQWTSGRSLGIYGGAGNDVLNFGNNNLPAFITNIAAFGFDGQDGYDTWNLLNASATGNWTYTRDTNLLAASRTSPAYGLTLSEARVEDVVVQAGTGVDTFNTRAVPTASRYFAYGNAGYDQLILGNANFSAEGIQGAVFYDAEADGGFVTVNDQSDTTGDTFHLTQNTLSAYAGDSLFGAGGNVSFQNLSDNGSTSGMNINLGSGSDVAYAQPLISATTVIQFNAQNRAGPEGGGDALNLALAGVSDPLVTGTTSGTVTSASHSPLLWFGAEVGPTVDDVAPEPLAGEFFYDVAAHQVDFTFTEDVSINFLPAYFYLTNVTGNYDIAPSDMAMLWDAGTNTAHITFPGQPNGTLPDGDYHVNLTAGYIDPFGNASTTPLEFDFFVLAGDANHDRTVGFDDLLVLAQNYGQTGMSFGQGDFNYDGNVDFDDLLLLAQRYGTTLITSDDPTRNADDGKRSDALTIVTNIRAKSRGRLSRSIRALL